MTAHCWTAVTEHKLDKCNPFDTGLHAFCGGRKIIGRFYLMIGALTVTNEK